MSVCRLVLPFLYLFVASSSAHTHSYDVVIIGAGASGLAAGMRLMKHNVTNIVILEARDRIGGRLHSVKMGSEVFDLGNEWTRSETGEVSEKMLEEGKMSEDLEEEDLKRVELWRYGGGGMIDPDLSTAAVSALVTLVQNSDLDRPGSYHDYLWPKFSEMVKDAGASDEDLTVILDALRNMESVEQAADPEKVSAKSIWAFSQEEDNINSNKNQYFIDFLKTFIKMESKKEDGLGLSEKIKLGHEVRGVEVGGEGATVTCSKGHKYHGKQVLVTLPLGVLKSLPEDFFQPKLDARKREVIEALGYGGVNVGYLKFEEAFWPENKLAILFGMTPEQKEEYLKGENHVSWAVKLHGFFPLVHVPTSLQVWTHSSEAKDMEMEDEEKFIEVCHEILQKVFNNETFTVPRPTHSLRSKWVNDPYAKGAYSYPSLEAEQKNIGFTDLAEPILDNNGEPVVLFAGEATVKLYGTVAGAALSGFREADRILKTTHH